MCTWDSHIWSPMGPSQFKLYFIHFPWGTAYDHNQPALGLTQTAAFPLSKAAFSIPENTCLPRCLIPLGSSRWSVAPVRTLSFLQWLQPLKQKGPQLPSAAPASPFCLARKDARGVGRGLQLQQTALASPSVEPANTCWPRSQRCLLQAAAGI